MEPGIISYQLLLAGAPNGCVKLAANGPRLHPGGGVPPDHQRVALEAGGQGETSPTRYNYHLFINLQKRY